MNLYHFTSHLALPHIKEEGIAFGDVPLTSSPDNHGEDTAVWFTTDKDPKRQGWQNPTQRGKHINNTAIRLTVEIPEEERMRLHRWRDYAARNVVDQTWQQRLEKRGGGDECATCWYLFKGIVVPEWITKVDELQRCTYAPSFVAKWELYKRSAHAQRGRIRHDDV